MEKDILQNHKEYLNRKEVYRKYGFDIDYERKAVIKTAEPFYGEILEVGTGKGHFALALAEKGYNFTSIDISEDEQSIASLNLQYFGYSDLVDLQLCNAEKLPFEDGSFDIVLSVNTAHHFDNPLKVADECIRVLSDSGKIVLSDFNSKGFDILDKIHAPEKRNHQRNEYVLTDIENHMLKKQFQIHKVETEYQKILVTYNSKLK